MRARPQRRAPAARPADRLPAAALRTRRGPTAWRSRAIGGAATRAARGCAGDLLRSASRAISAWTPKAVAGERRRHVLTMTQRRHAATPDARSARNQAARSCAVSTRSPGGTGNIVAMPPRACRRYMRSSLSCRRSRPISCTCSSWTNLGFLRLERVDWNSPRNCSRDHPPRAVHQIDGWGRPGAAACSPSPLLAFFHPQLPSSRQSSSEVALLPAMPAAIAPLIDKDLAPLRRASSKRPSFDQQLPARAQGCVAGQLPDQARGR